MAERKKPPRAELDVETLRGAGEFSVVFPDDKGLKCKLLAIDKYNLLVLSNGRRLLVPKHSIKYILLTSTARPQDAQRSDEGGPGTGVITRAGDGGRS